MEAYLQCKKEEGCDSGLETTMKKQRCQQHYSKTTRLSQPTLPLRFIQGFRMSDYVVCECGMEYAFGERCELGRLGPALFHQSTSRDARLTYWNGSSSLIWCPCRTVEIVQI